MGMQRFIAGLDGFQSCGGDCLIVRLDEIVFIGAGVGVVFGPLIAEIWVRVGSCDKDACCEESDHQD